MPGSQNPDNYTALLTTEDLALLERTVFALADRVELDPRPGPRAQAAIIRQAYFKLLEELREIARATALRAQEMVVKEEVATRVRPDTGGDGGKRLEDYIGRSNPLGGVEGSVGINFEPALFDNVPWWWTNEEGYSGHIGREVTGFFFDSGFTGPTRPDPAQFRKHPLFLSGGAQAAAFSDLGFGERGGGPQGGKGRRMTIRNPIPERRFVEHGYAKAKVKWHADIKRAKARFMAKIERALVASTPAPVRGKRP